MIHPFTAFLIGLVTAPPAQHSTQHRTRTRLNTKAAVARLPSHRRIVASSHRPSLDRSTSQPIPHRMQHQPPPCISSATSSTSPCKSNPSPPGPPPSQTKQRQLNTPRPSQPPHQRRSNPLRRPLPRPQYAPPHLVSPMLSQKAHTRPFTVNLSPASYDPAFGQGADASVKAKIINLIASVRTLMRIPLIGINTIVILYELVLG
ncbi:hypothetical protein BN1708_001045 [Verticillium longisporum]|uniref:Uncharacterized protein n=1 Tax=Verticillium longisporum TaxID=100787 RepID=A0A0G4MGJ0_VERLO|nr:hypothetical protein BN1708_001045 [Verticillium longisporum]